MITIMLIGLIMITAALLIILVGSIVSLSPVLFVVIGLIALDVCVIRGVIKKIKKK